MPFFLFNGFLLFGLAALIPVALHLLHKRKPQPYFFAAVRFIQDATAKSRRSRRVTQCVTLLMRVLIIIILAMAFAQPLVRSNKYLSEGQRVAVIVIDSSASMQAAGGDKSLFELAQTWAALLVDGLAEGDRVAILAPGRDDPRVVFPPVSDHQAVKSALLELKAGTGQADVAESIRDQLQRQDGGLANVEIHVFSDFQRASWNNDALQPMLDSIAEHRGALFFNQLVSAGGGDSGIASALFMPPAILGDGTIATVATISTNEQFVGTSILRLQGATGEEINHVALDLLPKDKRETRLQGMGSGAAPDWTGVLELSDDVFALNNRHYFSLPRLSGAPALLVNGGSDRDSFFLERALRPGGQAASLMLPQVVDWAGFMAGDISANAAIFICNPPVLDDAVRQKLDGYLQGGGVVMFFPGEEQGLSESTLRAFAPWEQLRAAPADQGEIQRLPVAVGNAHDPLVQKLQALLPPPWAVPIRKYLNIHPPTADEAVLSFRGGNAFVMRSSRGAGWLWLCATSANRDWSDWPMTPFFFIFMQELCKEAAGLRQPRLAAEVGGAIAIPWPGQITSAEFSITAPDGAERRLTVQRQNANEPFVLGGFSLPGIHSVQYGGMTRKLAVNIPAAESDLSYWRGNELVAGAKGIPAAHCLSHEQLRQEITTLRQGSPLWPLLLIMAFALSMIEVIFANLRSRPQDQPSFLAKILKQGGAVS